MIDLEDPVGKTLLSTELDRIELYSVTCPIGVIGIIFESRPDGCCKYQLFVSKAEMGFFLKEIRGKQNQPHSADIIIAAAEEAGIPPHWAALLETRADVNDMLKMDRYIDLIIPRGSNEFALYHG